MDQRTAAMGGDSLFFEKDRRVDFVIAGTQKGGTTALDFYLRQHSEIGMADCKEVHFFDREEYFRDGTPPYSTYHAHFTRNTSCKLLGEATPIYMYWHDAPRRIREYNPDVRIIVILRNPIDRAYSHWNMLRATGMETLSFREAIHREEERCYEALPCQHRLYSYVDRGFYVDQLRRIWTCFPEDQTLCLKTENLRDHPQRTLEDVCRFLRINPPNSIVPQEVHANLYACSMRRRERDYLRRVFECEIRNLERLLGWDCSDWLSETTAARKTMVRVTNSIRRLIPRRARVLRYQSS
jgi:hypothetical protein